MCTSFIFSCETPWARHLNEMHQNLTQLVTLEKTCNYEPLIPFIKQRIASPENIDSPLDLQNACAILERASNKTVIKAIGSQYSQELLKLADAQVIKTNARHQQLLAKIKNSRPHPDHRDYLHETFSAWNRAKNIKDRLEQFKTHVDLLT